MSDNIKLTEVKTAMLLHVPFFASLLLDMMKLTVGKFPHIFGDRTPTAATDGKTVYIDEDFLDSCSLPEAVFLICHEVGHAMWQHMARAKEYMDIGLNGKDFSPKKWNYAGDYIINDMLVQSEIGKMPGGGLHSADYTFDMLADDVYRLLPDDPDDGKTPGQGLLDVHIPAPDAAAPAEWKRATASAAAAAKSQGKLPEALDRFVEQLLNPKVAWQDEIRAMLVKIAGRDSHTWSKPNRRRLITQGIVMPSYIGFGCGVIVIGVDTSGSISEKELTIFLTEIQSIMDISKPEKVYIVPCDAAVHAVSERDPGDSLIDDLPQLGGGGGTAFEPVFDWVEENMIDPAALVYLTDMYGSFPDEAPKYPVIWASTTEGYDHPFGSFVHIDIADYDE